MCFPEIEFTDEMLHYRSIDKEMEALRELTSKKYCYLPIPELIDKINEQLRGWKEYFSKGYPRMAYRKINWYVENVWSPIYKSAVKDIINLPKGLATMHMYTSWE